jgi:hypothetical protein
MFTPLKSKLAIVIGGGLLIITFSMGILLVQTVGERNVIKTSLENANTKIKEQDGKIKEKTKEADNNLESFNGCQAQQIINNKRAVEEALAQAEFDRLSSGRADQQLSALPELIDQDRLAAAQPKAASIWLQSLFK